MFESKTESESTAESKTKCGAYFTVVHSHGAAYFKICVKTQVACSNYFDTPLAEWTRRFAASFQQRLKTVLHSLKEKGYMFQLKEEQRLGIKQLFIRKYLLAFLLTGYGISLIFFLSCTDSVQSSWKAGRSWQFQFQSKPDLLRISRKFVQPRGSTSGF